MFPPQHKAIRSMLSRLAEHLTWLYDCNICIHGFNMEGQKPLWMAAAQRQGDSEKAQWIEACDVCRLNVKYIYCKYLSISNAVWWKKAWINSPHPEKKNTADRYQVNSFLDLTSKTEEIFYLWKHSEHVLTPWSLTFLLFHHLTV